MPQIVQTSHIKLNTLLVLNNKITFGSFSILICEICGNLELI